ncbi:MAG: YruB family glutaredoxin [Candidatus Saccharibacteria bacterium]|nr:YruB family glutaredoxin [Candidatus Saccharibacteria bacterium]
MVTIYTTPTCVFCHAAKEYFKSRKVEYEEKDASTDRTAAQWIWDHTGQLGVPVIDIDGNLIIGFDRPRIDMALRDKKLV